jgi:putative NIF3 family GTP cyclohydrolase 1 type 2
MDCVKDAAMTFSRRSAMRIGAAAAAAASLPAWPARAAGPVTAGQVVDRMWARLAEEGIKKRSATVDEIVAGNPATPVAGIATVFMATWDILKRARAQNLNMVISHEPTFWSVSDDFSILDNREPVLMTKKRAWIEANNMVVFRTHDHWHERRPEPMSTTWTNRVGWGKFEEPGGRAFNVPETTLGALARELEARLKTRNVRVVGDPGMKVRTVARGGHQAVGVLTPLIEYDVVIVSEGREFDSFEYARDANDLGFKRGLIFISHQQGEEYGMQPAEPWVSSIVPEVPVRYLESGEAFWIA